VAVFDPKTLSSGLYNPAAAPNQIYKPSTSVAQASPGIYTASLQTGLNRDESVMIEGWSVIHNKHKELMQMSNADAGVAYSKLDEDTRGLLDAYYGVDYKNRLAGGALGFGQKILGGQGNDGISVGDALKSPFRLLFAGGEAYGRGVNAPGRAKQLSDTNQEVKFNESFSNEAIFDPQYLKPLAEKYGVHRTHVATGLLKGMTPGEIIESWGPNDAEMLVAVSEVFENSKTFNKMLSEFEKTQLSPGRTIGHDVNKELNINAEDHPWLWRFGTGSIDLAYQIFADPLTYASGGLGLIPKALGYTSKTDKLLKGTRSITEHFADPDVQKFWTGFSDGLAKYGDAVEAKDLTKAAEIRTTLKNNYPQYANDSVIELFSKGKYDPSTLQTVAPIRDLESAEAFFEAANMTSLLIRGRVSGIKFQREGIATMKRGRDIKTGIRLKTREVLKGKDDFDALDAGTLEELADELARLGSGDSGDFNIVNDIIEENRKKGLSGWIDRMSARHPGNKEIYTSDERYSETLDLVREQAFVALGDKRMAEAVAIKFANSVENERIAIRRALDETTMRKMEVDKVPDGEDFITDILDRKYGVKGSFSAAEELTLPARGTATGEAGIKIPVSGPLLPFQNTSALGSLPWQEIKFFKAQKSFTRAVDILKEEAPTLSEKAKKARILPELIGGAFNNRVTELGMSVWSTLTLAPRLGMRTAIDEGTFFGLYLTTGLAKELLAARRAQDIITAATGSKAGVGPVKEFIQATISKFPGINVGARRKISQGEKDLLENKYEEMYKRGEIELHEIDKMYESDILDLAIDRIDGGRKVGPYTIGRRLDDEERSWIKQAAIGNLNILKDASTAQLADVFGAKTSAVLPEQSLMRDSHLTAAMKTFGITSDEAYRLLSVEGDKLYLAMYHNFITAFATKPYKLADKTMLSPAALFITNNGLKTKEDWATAKSQFMQKIGFGDIGNGQFELIDEALAREFLNQSRQNLDDGRTINQIAENFVDATFSELTYRFHGSADDINETFIDYFKTQANPDGTPMPAFAVASDINFEKYKELVGSYTIKGQVRTPLDFGPQTHKLETWITKYGLNKIYEVMTRTTDDLFRQPVVHAHYLMYRRQYSLYEQQYSDQIFKSLQDDAASKNKAFDADKIRKRADDMSSRYFSEHSMEDAVHHTLKYSDNGDVRSVFAVNVRTVGRFYRATEDFYRRMYRLVADRGVTAIYRARLMQQGLSAVGSLHRDEDGELYLVMPMDDAVFSAVNSALGQYPGWKGSGVSQPLFNDITFKLSAGNPSFQDDAGVPYLSGPVGALSVMSVQAFLRKFNFSKNAAEDIDNLLLGDLGDNITFYKAVVPRSLQLLWSSLSPDEKDQQEVSAAMQAIAYYQANGYGVYPEDYVKLDADGNLIKDEAAYENALVEYQENVQITAHNVLFLRNMLGLISPITPQLRDTKDLPTALKNIGIASMSDAFYDILDEVERFYPSAPDHYELALAVFAGNNKGKLAYTVSRSEAGVVATYSEDMQNWVISNQDAVNKYGNAAVMFAPKVGEFTPGVYNWAKGAELINQKEIKDYLDEVTLQESINNYFDLEEQESLQLSTTPLPDDRKNIIMRHQELRRLMKLQTPKLETRLENIADNEEKTKFLTNAYTVANDPDINIKPEVRSAVNDAFAIYEDFLLKTESETTRLASNSSDMKRSFRDDAFVELEALIKQDKSGVVKELFRHSLKGLMNAKSRDARNTISGK
jgi:hypothetical protein